jgi:hypothetical protein
MKHWKKSEFAKTVSRYHEGEDCDKIIVALLEICTAADSIGITTLPLIRFVIVRICSKLRIETVVVDAKLREVLSASEDTLFGKIYPVLGWEPVNCKHYGKWFVGKLDEKLYLESLNLEEKVRELTCT